MDGQKDLLNCYAPFILPTSCSRNMPVTNLGKASLLFPAKIYNCNVKFDIHFDDPYSTNDNGGGEGELDVIHAEWILYLKLTSKKPAPHWYTKNRNNRFAAEWAVYFIFSFTTFKIADSS